MNRSIIGISGSIENEQTMNVGRSYTRAILRAGGIPVLLAPDMDEAAIEDCLGGLDGILMAGGVDYHPSYYGEEPIPELGSVSPLRDTFEILLLKKAIEKNIPVFGICRGIQSMNVALGGTLWQDLPSQFHCENGQPCMHSQSNPTAEPSHGVKILSGTRLSALLNQSEIRTNSHHHQAIKQPGKGFRISAYSEDGVPEAAEHESLFFYCAVQWHPERLVAETSPVLFDYFVKACDEYRLKKAKSRPESAEKR